MKTVFVGLSGGVDSAVSAALLKSQGYNVVGAFIKIWQPEFTECTWVEDRLDAMRVCVALGIPFKEIDLSHEYKKRVVEEMVAGYAKGITPNPDVLCNRSIKFGPFWQWAKENGADMIATGHYARIAEKQGSFKLLRGIDDSKDQSYFLYQLTEEDLSHTIFPIGEMTKREVRAKAATLDLPVAKKHDSQGLCFVGEVSMQDFLRRFITVEKGLVVNSKGETIGEHEGAALYTLGQRHGFSVHAKEGGQYYITQIDTEKNLVQVSTDRNDAAKKRVTLTDARWVGEIPSIPASFEVEVRYRAAPVHANVEKNEEGITVEFDIAQIAAPGQSLVIYDGEQLLGGGVIHR